MPSLTLIYFDLPGRAEVSRLALTIGDIPFIDKRIAREEWAALKPSLPFQQIPVLYVDDHVFSQSHAIERYVGNLSGLYPSNSPLNGLLVDEILDFVEEILTLLIPARLEVDSTRKKELCDSLVQGKLTTMLQFLEKRLNAIASDTWLLDTISIADLSVFGIIDRLQNGWLPDIPTGYCNQFPKTISIYNAVRAHPKVVAWYASHLA